MQPFLGCVRTRLDHLHASVFEPRRRTNTVTHHAHGDGSSTRARPSTEACLFRRPRCPPTPFLRVGRPQWLAMSPRGCFKHAFLAHVVVVPRMKTSITLPHVSSDRSTWSTRGTSTAHAPSRTVPRNPFGSHGRFVPFAAEDPGATVSREDRASGPRPSSAAFDHFRSFYSRKTLEFSVPVARIGPCPAEDRSGPSEPDRSFSPFKRFQSNPDSVPFEPERNRVWWEKFVLGRSVSSLERALADDGKRAFLADWRATRRETAAPSASIGSRSERRSERCAERLLKAPWTPKGGTEDDTKGDPRGRGEARRASAASSHTCAWNWPFETTEAFPSCRIRRKRRRSRRRDDELAWSCPESAVDKSEPSG